MTKEEKVLTLLIRGMTSVGIASKLKISLRTVEYRREKLMKHYQARTAFQLGYKVNQSDVLSSI